MSNFFFDFSDLEQRWIKFSPNDASFPSAVRYLNTRMFKDRDLEPIQDRRKFRQLAHTLTKFRNKYCDVEPVNLQYYNQMTQEKVFEYPCNADSDFDDQCYDDDDQCYDDYY